MCVTPVYFRFLTLSPKEVGERGPRWARREWGEKMEPWLGVSWALGILLLLLLLCWKKDHPRNLPPGPPSWPLLGSLLHLKGPSLLHSLLKLREQYGNVFTIYVGSQRAVVLCGYQTVKAALVDQAEEFGARAELPLVEKTSKGHGIFFSNGENWRQIRRFALTTLRNFGMGKRSIEERIQEEIKFLMEEFRKTQGSPFDPTFVLRRSVSNIICSVVFGERFQYDNSEFQALLYLFQQNARRVDTIWVQLYGLFPQVLKHLPGPHNRLFENYEEQKRYAARMVQKHEDTLDPASPRDYIDTFLIRMQQDSGNPSTIFHQENLIVSTLDLFFAGTETVSNTLRYGLLILLKYPEITERIQEEIDQIVGPNRAPAMEDRLKMPYTDAVIHEMQRFIDIIPLGVPHSVTCDTEFAGYTIPKGTFVFLLLNSVLHDPTQFEAPETFDPGHFLDDKGKFKKAAAFIPFSAGKRSCPGEGLARMELFLYLSTMLQKFALTSPIASEEIDITPEYSGFGKAPCLYQLCLIPR
ncbi:cytochrome P450 2G1-like [Rhineura floridana]|uniref:cytochrome P450 2G1-like n=1 Tax=Rhineura floridana TaxID=261503 RepID=UPI002AC827F3|nr:cytochrome P450 2G1-like [Rhineura floridana]